MNIKKIAIAAILPAVTGVTVSGWAAVQAVTSHPGTHAAVHQVHAARLAHPAGPARPHPASPAAHGSDHKQVSKARLASSGAGHASRPGPGHPAPAPAPRHRAAPARPAAAQVARPAASPASMLTGMSAFEQCVAWHESGDNPTASSAGLFGILPATWASLGYQGTAGDASVTMQKAAFDRLYAQDGTAPWAPYDGC
jgi:hypothetical protein